MIRVREVFQIAPDKMREAKALAREMAAYEVKMGGTAHTMLTDLTGEYYRLVLESEFESLAAFETALGKAFGTEEWQRLYAPFRALIRGGSREILTVVS